MTFKDAIATRITSNHETMREFARCPTVPQNYQFISICADCGQRCSQNHHHICPANGTKCNNFGVTGHFANKCREHKKSLSQMPKRSQTTVNQIDTNNTKSADEESGNYITSYQQLCDQLYDSNCDNDSDDYVAAISSDSAAN